MVGAAATGRRAARIGGLGGLRKVGRMGHQLAADTLVMAATSLLLAGEAVYCWRRAHFGGRGFFTLFLVVGAVVSLCATLLFLGTAENWILRWSALWEALGSTLAPTLILLFAARFASDRRLCGRRAVTTLVGGSAVLVVAIAIDPSLVYLPGHG